ncbi:hypothetical protein [Deinococcus sp.]|uniref:hypothetical protein n=1 Tax=Deinococcus sp. TaxID=47478 RepID=UPI0025C6701D|nr:hypothetical protein [Deinococcus sp.]
MKTPAWRIWLTTALVCGWGILAIRFFQKENVPFAIMSVCLMIANGVILWQQTKKGQ